MRNLKTEKNGSKKGRGAFYGLRQIAKKVSRKQRRANDKTEINKEAKDGS